MYPGLLQQSSRPPHPCKFDICNHDCVIVKLSQELLPQLTLNVPSRYNKALKSINLGLQLIASMQGLANINVYLNEFMCTLREYKITLLQRWCLMLMTHPFTRDGSQIFIDLHINLYKSLKCIIGNTSDDDLLHSHPEIKDTKRLLLHEFEF